MSRILLLLTALLVGLVVSVAASAQLGGSDFLPPDQAFSYQVTGNDDHTLTIAWDIAPGYYLYRKQLKIEGKPQRVAAVELPAGKQVHDEYFGDSEVYHDRVAAVVAPGNARTPAMNRCSAAARPSANPWARPV
ncbi:MAG: protein-disulfide reductase DsbD domain-containing protein [Rhodanobacteraceae bacterium]